MFRVLIEGHLKRVALFNPRLLAGGAAACVEGAVCFEAPCPKCRRSTGFTAFRQKAAYFILILLSHMLSMCLVKMYTVQCIYLIWFNIYYVRCIFWHKLSKEMHHSASQWTWNYLDQRFVPFVSIQPHCWKGCQEHQTYLKSVKMMVSCTSLRSDDMSLNPTPCDTVMEAFQVLSAKRQHWKEHGGSLESKKLLSDESFI